MLYLIYGNDREEGRAQFRALRDKFLREGVNIENIQEGNISEKMFDEKSSARGLFGDITLFIFDNVIQKREEQEIFASRAGKLKDSKNYFLVFEPSLLKDIAKEIVRDTTESFEYSKKTDDRPPFNIFSLGDALGERNKKELWVLYQQAVGAGCSSEEISGTIFWAIKNMALLKQARKGDDSGLNPFVARKARVFASHYTREEIISLSRQMISLYHEAHRGGEPMDIALERFILNL